MLMQTPKKCRQNFLFTWRFAQTGQLHSCSLPLSLVDTGLLTYQVEDDMFFFSLISLTLAVHMKLHNRVECIRTTTTTTTMVTVASAIITFTIIYYAAG
jgi:hypothetical protein